MSDKIVSAVLPVLGVFPSKSETLVLRAEALFNQGGEDKLNAEDRRGALAYLMVVRADMSNYELGSLFKVSEGLIRKDKELVRKQMADETPTDDITVFLSDLRRYYEVCRAALARSEVHERELPAVDVQPAQDGAEIERGDGLVVAGHRAFALTEVEGGRGNDPCGVDAVAAIETAPGRDGAGTAPAHHQPLGPIGDDDAHGAERASPGE